ncbi:MAG: hypothetical protein V9E83_06120 [Baekduia sp.]
MRRLLLAAGAVGVLLLGTANSAQALENGFYQGSPSANCQGTYRIENRGGYYGFFGHPETKMFMHAQCSYWYGGIFAPVYYPYVTNGSVTYAGTPKPMTLSGGMWQNPWTIEYGSMQRFGDLWPTTNGGWLFCAAVENATRTVRLATGCMWIRISGNVITRA